jgi:cell division protein FtsN
MAQDFAKQRPPQQQASRKPGKGARPPARFSQLNWFISGFLFGILSVAGAYLGLVQYQNMHPDKRETGAGKTAPDKLPAFDFGFYHELAKAEVPVKVQETAGSAPVATTAKTAPHPAAEAPQEADAAAVNFLLQAGSFQDKQEADERRAKITLLNMSAEIVPGVVAGRTWYRVQVGPFNGRNAAEDARKQLSASNIDSIPLLMR